MRRSRTAWALFAFVLGGAFVLGSAFVLDSAPAFAQDEPEDNSPARPSLRAEPLIEGDAITVDGRFDEAIWSRATEVSGFVERRPVRGAVPPVNTRFSVAFDEDALYFAITCELAPGETPRVAELTRDTTRIFSDDALSVKLDVRGDQRNTVGFVVNAGGARLDYIAIDNGRSFRPEFDAVWEAEVRVDEDAFRIELRIPAHALGLSETGDQRVMGLELSRDHNARRATYDWAPIPVEFGAMSAIHYGRLEIPGRMAGGRTLSIVPYIAGGLREDAPGRFPSSSPWTVSAGVDARLRLGEDIWTELTALTDFAQVDLDNPTVNLDRFPLFFPERRRFFLRGADVFSFGEEGSLQPFFTRRIGIGRESEEVLMLGGAKVYGRAPLQGGRSLGFGILEALTYDGTTASTTVARLRLNLGKASYIGAISTLLADADNRADVTTGVDFLARSGRFEISGFASGSFGERLIDEDEEDGPKQLERGYSGQATLRWRGEVFRPLLQMRYVDERFDPAVGFVRRGDVFQARTDLNLQFRTSAYGLEAIDVIPYASQLVDSDFSRDVGRNYGLSLRANFVNGMFYYVGVEGIHDVVDEDFTIADRDVSAGIYDGVTMYSGLSRSGARNPSFGIEYLGQASFFGGVKQTLNLRFGFYATRHFRFEASGASNFITLPDNNPFATFSGSATIVVAPTTTIQLDAALQLNTASEETIALARFRWRYTPGSDLFLVYREQRPFGAEADPVERRLLLKWTYRADILL
ncbi:MAG: hypothetical protein ACI9KE_003272 [Polyangiales bacterium]|jgi:hypothetical protein